MDTKQYAWSSRVTVGSLDGRMRGKVAVKSSSDSWIAKPDRSIILLSVQSSFHADCSGECKLGAFISVVQSNIKSEFIIIIADTAHINVELLGNREGASACITNGVLFRNRFKEFFKDIKVMLWSDFVLQHKDYLIYKEKIEALNRSDVEFRNLLLNDAGSTYTEDRSIDYPDRETFVQATVQDLIDQCVYLMISVKENYKYHLHPSRPYQAYEYVIKKLIEPEKTCEFIYFFVSVEKKRIISKPTQGVPAQECS